MNRSAGEPAPLGAVEWDSIAKGVRAADALLKAAPVSPLVFRAITPGRYVALFTGDVDSIHAAVARGIESGEDSVVDHLVLPRPHAGLRAALGGKSGARRLSAVGILETLTVSSILLAADAAAKAGNVEVNEIRLAMGLGGKSFAVVTGEVSNVEAAVERGASLARERGLLLSSVVIPNPDPLTLEFLTKPLSPFRDFVI